MVSPMRGLFLFHRKTYGYNFHLILLDLPSEFITQCYKFNCYGIDQELTDVHGFLPLGQGLVIEICTQDHRQVEARSFLHAYSEDLKEISHEEMLPGLHLTRITHQNSTELDPYEGKDLLLEIRVNGKIFRHATTVQQCMESLTILESGCVIEIIARFNFQIVGTGQYRKEGRELVILEEMGAAKGLFTPSRLLIAELGG